MTSSRLISFSRTTLSHGVILHSAARPYQRITPNLFFKYTNKFGARGTRKVIFFILFWLLLLQWAVYWFSNCNPNLKKWGPFTFALAVCTSVRLTSLQIFRCLCFVNTICCPLIQCNEGTCKLIKSLVMYEYFNSRHSFDSCLLDQHRTCSSLAISSINLNKIFNLLFFIEISGLLLNYALVLRKPFVPYLEKGSG